MQNSYSAELSYSNLIVGLAWINMQTKYFYNFLISEADIAK